MRTCVFWCHLAVGVAAGLVILVMSVTGALLAFEPQILAFVERDVRTVEPPAGGAGCLPLAVLIARAANGRDAAVTGVTLDADPRAAAQVAFGADTVYADRYSGRVLGAPSARARDAFRTITNWHRWLAAGVERRGPARAITGAANLGFLLLAVSGVYLWWPRGGAWARLTAAMRRNPVAAGKTGDFNRHTVVGFWCAPLLFVITASGVVLSYSWANNLVYRVVGSPVPERRAGGPARGPEGPRATGPTVGADTIEWDRIADAATRRLPTWGTMTIRADRPPEIVVTLTDAEYWNAFARSTLTLDAGAAVRRWAPYGDQTAGQKARGWIRFAHTGELGGWIGQGLALVACAAGVVLVWSGFSLAVRRLSRVRRTRRDRVVRARAA